MSESDADCPICWTLATGERQPPTARPEGPRLCPVHAAMLRALIEGAIAVLREQAAIEAAATAVA